MPFIHQLYALRHHHRLIILRYIAVYTSRYSSAAIFYLLVGPCRQVSDQIETEAGVSIYSMYDSSSSKKLGSLNNNIIGW